MEKKGELIRLKKGLFVIKAAFYGGTCLRIFYGSKRFSEDMDFSLLQSDENFKQLLKEKISITNIEMVRADVRPFIKNPEVMEIWSAEYFSQLVDMIQFEKFTP